MLKASGGRVLVTGGAGFIGTHLVRGLIDAGAEVVILDNLSPQVHGDAPVDPPEGAQLVVGDVRDRAAVRHALAGVDGLVHLAAETGVGQSAYEIARYVDVNERGTAVVLEEAARLAGQLRSVVLASSRAVYGEGRYECPRDGEVYPTGRRAEDLAAGRFEPACPACGGALAPLPAAEGQRLDPVSVYGVTKLNQEQLLACFARAYRVPATALRFQNVYGPGQALGNPYTGIMSIFATRLMAGGSVEVYEDGRPTRDFVFVDDAVDSIRLALDRPPQSAALRVANVGSGRGISVLEAAGLLARMLGRRNAVKVTGKYRVGDIRHARADLAAAERELGFAPRVGFEAGLGRFLGWLRETRPADDRLAGMEREMAGRGLLAAAQPAGAK